MNRESAPLTSTVAMRRRRLLQSLGAVTVAGLPRLAMAQTPPTAQVNTTRLAVTDSEVVVGQLHSSTGTMAISETGSIQAEQLAIDQINAAGGILGRKIRVIKEDGASDWPTFAEKSRKPSRRVFSFSRRSAMSLFLSWASGACGAAGWFMVGAGEGGGGRWLG